MESNREFKKKKDLFNSPMDNFGENNDFVVEINERSLVESRRRGVLQETEIDDFIGNFLDKSIEYDDNLNIPFDTSFVDYLGFIIFHLFYDFYEF
jgi:hypothetical protein